MIQVLMNIRETSDDELCKHLILETNVAQVSHILRWNIFEDES
jgi:hypothetical protein